MKVAITSNQNLNAVISRFFSLHDLLNLAHFQIECIFIVVTFIHLTQNICEHNFPFIVILILYSDILKETISSIVSQILDIKGAFHCK